MSLSKISQGMSYDNVKNSNGTFRKVKAHPKANRPFSRSMHLVARTWSELLGVGEITAPKKKVATWARKRIPTRVCHFFTIDLNLSVVRVDEWNVVRQFLPWTSSQMRLNLR
ncbi:hypothetical protein TCAL_15207 [Tigriopus californicus]|uniref:Uncharacterized protein n=1 Tax=Tigriopus californicus TaxID=6832 RepID=A0A553NBY0_TIGCA|nr:hypothetical protein TCAL_15207 [Tigriopus californicus]